MTITQVFNCNIQRLTIGTLPSREEDLIQALKKLAINSGETCADEMPLYYWLEDIDDIVYIDGPVYDPEIRIESESFSFSLGELLSQGGSKQVVDEQLTPSPTTGLMCYSEQFGEGALSHLQLSGDSNEFEALLKDITSIDSAEFSALSANTVILTKKWLTPLYPFEMFVGIAYKCSEAYDIKDHWGDGSYESSVDTSQASILRRRLDAKEDEFQWEELDYEELEKIVAAVCEGIESQE